MKNRRKPLLVVFAVTVFLCFSLGLSGPAVGDITPFSQDVNDAIDDGLDYIRNNNLLTNQNDSTGLLLLALLEKRQSADFNAPIVGYTGLDTLLTKHSLIPRLRFYAMASISPVERASTPTLTG